MAKIADLPALENIDETATVLVEQGGVTGRGSLGDALAPFVANTNQNIDNLQGNLDLQIAARLVVEEALRGADDALAENIGNVQANLDTQIAARHVVEDALRDADDNLAQNIANVEANTTLSIDRIDALPKLAAADLDRPILSNPRASVLGGSFVGGTFNAFIVAVCVDQDEPALSSLTVWLGGLAGRAQLRVTAIDRPLAVGDGANHAPGYHPQDVERASWTRLVPDLVDNYKINVAQPVRIDIRPAGLLRANVIRFFRIEALNSSGGVQSFGAALGQALPAGTPYWKCGWIRDGINYGGLAPSMALAYILSRAGTRQQNADIGFVEQLAVPSDTLGHIKTLPPIVRRDTQAVTLTTIGDLTFLPPTPVAKSNFPVMLDLGRPAPLDFEPQGGSVFARRASDDAPLTEDVDYRIDYASGSLLGLNGNVAAYVDFIGLPIRYDVVYDDLATRAVAVMQGPARGYDACEYIPHVEATPDHPEYANAGPLLPIGARPLYVVRVNWLDAKIIPVHNWRGLRKLGQTSDESAWLAYNREYFAPLIAKAQTGAPITITNVGTSLGAQGDDQSIENANGERDMLSFYDTARIADDTLARITSHDGPAGSGAHQHLGWCWGIKEALEAWGSVVTYLNRGLSGSSTRDVSRGLTNDVRLAPVYADNADLIVADIGENDDGQDYIYEDTIRFVQKIRANSPGSLILLIPGAFNARFSSNVTPEMTGYTYEQVKQAAIDCGVGYLDHALLFAPGNEGAIGHAWEDRSLQNGINHDGPGVMLALRRMAARIFRW